VKISIVTGPFLGVPPSPAGAVEQIWYGLAVEFAKRGHDVTIVARRGRTAPDDSFANGVRVVRRLTFRRSGRLAIDLCKDFAHAVAIQRFIPTADIVVVNSFWLPAITPWLRGKSTRLVYNFARIPKGQLWLYGRVYRLAAVSQAVRDEIAKQHPAALPRTRVIPNPIHTDVFTPPAAGRPSRGRKVVLFTGRVHPEKGGHLLIDAFRRLYRDHQDAVLRIIGPTAIEEGGGGNAYITTLQSLATGLPVEFLPAIHDRHALARALHEADVYCYPSLADRGESFGVAPLEAMATGLPTVVSNLACFRDFVSVGENAMVFDHHAADPAAALSEALGQLLSQPTRCLRLGEKAAETAQRFGYPQVADMYLDDFAGLISQA